jgi:hypothetical protein
VAPRRELDLRTRKSRLKTGLTDPSHGAEDRREYPTRMAPVQRRAPLDLTSEGQAGQRLDGIWASAPYLHNDL